MLGYYLIGPGGLRAPPVVADEIEAGYCFHLLFSFSTPSAFYPQLCQNIGRNKFSASGDSRSGSKAKDGKKRKQERLKVGNINGQLRIANANVANIYELNEISTSKKCI